MPEADVCLGRVLTSECFASQLAQYGKRVLPQSDGKNGIEPLRNTAEAGVVANVDGRGDDLEPVLHADRLIV